MGTNVKSHDFYKMDNDKAQIAFVADGGGASPNDEVEITNNNLFTALNEWLSKCESNEGEIQWRLNAEESYQFYAGKQDTQEVIDKLDKDGRPNPVFNTIQPKINMLVGLAAQSNRVPYVFPVSSEDTAITELMNNTYKHYRRKLKISKIENECFEHTTKSGRAYQYFYTDSTNPFKPEIKSKRLSGFDVRKDPKSTDYFWRDCRYVFIDKWLDKDEVMIRFPLLNLSMIESMAESQASTSYNPIYYNTVLGLYRITEVWYRKATEVIWFVNPLTNEPENLLPSDFTKFIEQLKKGVPYGEPNENGERGTYQLNQDIQTYRRVVQKIYYCIFSGNQIIERGPTPYKVRGKELEHFPIVEYGCYRDDILNMWISVIEAMKDPARSRNTTRRQLINLLQTSQKNMLAHEQGALVDEDEYDKNSSKPGFRFVIHKGQFDKWKFTTQPQIPQIYAELDALFEQDEKNSSGVQDSLLGIQTSSREPGITVRMRQQQGMAVLFILFDNFRHSKLHAAHIMMFLIQQYVTEPELIRIGGQEGGQLMAINTQTNPQIPGFNDVSALEYDFSLDEAVDTSTMRMAIAQMLTDFSQNNPGTIPPDIIMEYSDLPLTVINKVRAYQEMIMKQQQANFEAELEAKREGNLIKAVNDENRIKAQSKSQSQSQNKVAKPKPKPKAPR